MEVVVLKVDGDQVVAESLLWLVDHRLVVGWSGLHLVDGDLEDEGPAEVPDEEDLDEDLGVEEQAWMMYWLGWVGRFLKQVKGDGCCFALVGW